MASIRSRLVPLVRPGLPLYGVVEFIEAELKQAGASPAFPVNVSINEVAAHYGPVSSPEPVFHEGDLVKVDFGAHFEGWPVDNAVTFDLGASRGPELLQASQFALSTALEIIRARGPEATLSEIGTAIQQTITQQGFHPITNLTGHSMEQWDLHSGISIYNYDCKSDKPIGMGLFAVEPFATDGAGQVRDGAPSSIFKLMTPKPQRLPQLRQLMKELSAFRTLPFSSAWVSQPQYLPLLVRQGVLHNYPQLVEVRGGLVSQAEHTVLITGDRVEVVTL